MHRDFGYLFFAITIIYAISGIAINHINDWNPNYNISVKEVQTNIPSNPGLSKKNIVLNLLEELGEEDNYKKHYLPGNGQLKVFLDGGNLVIDLDSGYGLLEKIKRRPILNAFNELHYNPGKWWTLFSDIYTIALILISISGLLILKGKKGITARGAWLTVLGILIPIALFYNINGASELRFSIEIQIIAFFVWYALSMIISETIGKRSKFGVEWSFLICFLLTPIIGYLIVYGFQKKRNLI